MLIKKRHIRLQQSRFIRRPNSFIEKRKENQEESDNCGNGNMNHK